jgi:ATP-dependent Clp protease ATP-binding subunit ClpB
MTSELATVLQGAAEAARAAGDKFVTAERLLESVARQSALRALFTRAGIDPKALAEAGEQWRQGRKANEAQVEQNWEALAKYSRDLTEEAKNGKLDPVIGRDDEIRRIT